LKILVVEDEKDLAGGLKRGFEAEGFDVEVALDGVTGLEAARRLAFDVLVVDLLLPGMNGFKICSTLRAEKDWTPILILTAKDGEFDEAEALDCGADDYLTKPFSHVVLLARIRALMRRKEGADGGPIQELTAPGLRLDVKRRRCFRNENEIALTAREHQVLECLMRGGGKVHSKREILDDVWGYGFDGDPNIVEVYIRRLREKLDRPFGSELIETVRRLGYRIRVEP
jgi:DNA-binding response OmpR family regulator